MLLARGAGEGDVALRAGGAFLIWGVDFGVACLVALMFMSISDGAVATVAAVTPVTLCSENTSSHLKGAMRPRFVEATLDWLMKE